jgi:hypothetical protein
MQVLTQPRPLAEAHQIAIDAPVIWVQFYLRSVMFGDVPTVAMACKFVEIRALAVHRRRRYGCSYSPRNLPAQVIQILKTGFSSLRVHRISEVGYAFLDAETRLGPSQFRSHPARRHEQ